MDYIKSPMNYIGNKFRIIDQIQRYFPTEIDTMVDLFCGGCDVTINTNARKKYANDINYHVIDIFKTFQQHSEEYILNYIDTTIKEWGLSKTNEEAYKRFRDYYNQTKNSLDLYILMCFSFNYQFRFNSKHEYNNPFGKNRSSFNDKMRNNLINMLKRLDNIEFSSKPFQDFDFGKLPKESFVYADPPYLITCGSYNDGKRGFTGWGENEERTLCEILTDLDKNGINFALSNVIEHKGIKNEILQKWCINNNYQIHNINFNYNNSNYHGKNTDKLTKEILITNY